MMKPVSVKTPCIGICSTTSVGDSICRGCKRFAAEVIEWNLYSDSQKAAVLTRLSRLVEPLMDERFIIRSPRDLASGLKRDLAFYTQSPCELDPQLSPVSEVTV